jgi:hypothetical protein
VKEKKRSSEYLCFTLFSGMTCGESVLRGLCPLCDTPLGSRSVATNILAPTADKLVQLCGLPPNESMFLVFSFSFYSTFL